MKNFMARKSEQANTVHIPTKYSFDILSLVS